MRILTFILPLVCISAFALEVTSDTYSQWHERALNGDPTAQYMLGYYWDKKGGYEIEAKKWYDKSLICGDPETGMAHAALRNIAYYYENGLGVPEDLIEAYAYYNLAAGHGGASSIDVEDKNRVKNKLTIQAVLEGQRRSSIIQKQLGSNISDKSDDNLSSIISSFEKYSYIIVFVVCTLLVGASYTLIKEKLTKSNRGRTKFDEEKIAGSSYSQSKDNKVTYFSCWWKTALVLLLLQGLLGYLNSGTQGMALMVGRGLLLSPLHALWIGWIWWRIKR